LDAWIQEREQLVLREDDLHWLDEGTSQSKEDKGARDGGDEDPSKKGKGIVMDSFTSSSDGEDGCNGGEEVSGDESDVTIMEETPVLREGPMMLVEANKVVLICHGIQISMPHKILIMEAD